MTCSIRIRAGDGGDKREELPVQSAALPVETAADEAEPPRYRDLRADATETPIAALRETHCLARQADEQLRERAEEE